ncbi:hypothetical protein T4B_7646 [Trichinella pseudospiralis]|uniref:Uncharacterized protein n=1 Tax=Trichinella pseudospiralis TaxID=6337 RepID=A0A0V1JA39_TRIPS|nr:hypothetical protein T4B_7646 [Trichinella pseudospiralis]
MVPLNADYFTCRLLLSVAFDACSKQASNQTAFAAINSNEVKSKYHQHQQQQEQQQQQQQQHHHHHHHHHQQQQQQQQQ